jgi:hypothetical protein
MKKYIAILCLLVSFVCGLSAQTVTEQREVEITGLVIDEHNEPLIGVNVVVKDRPGLGAITQIDGKFKIRMEPYQRLVFSFIGYENQEVLIKEQRSIKVIMKEAVATALDEVVVTGTGTQKKLLLQRLM